MICSGRGGSISLGWEILPDGDYTLGLPRLSPAEEAAIEAAEHRFKEKARVSNPKTREESQGVLKSLLHDHARDNSIYLDSGQAEYLSKMAMLHIYGFAFLDVLLADPEIEEVSVIGLRKPAYVYLRNSGWKSVNAAFTEESAVSDVVNKMARGIGRHITVQNPRLDAVLPDGSRLHASLPPVSPGEITIRKFRERPFSPRELVELGTVNAGAVALLSLVMQADSSVLIAGNTASGKTTTLNALFSFVPANERIIIAEETPEINIPHAHQLRLVANRETGISLKDLVYDSLRMRPDRMVVGEVRNREEAEALFDVVLAGQARGCYATCHAQSAGEALARLSSFGIAAMDMRSLDCVLVQRRMLLYDIRARKSREVRRVVEIAGVGGGGAYGVFVHDARRDVLAMRNADGLLENISGKLGSSLRETRAELERRKTLITKMDRDFGKFYAAVQEDFYGERVRHGDGKVS